MSQQGPQTSWIGQTIGGRYVIEEVLGQGGMSSVYQATDPNLQRTVAIKLIHPHLSSDEEFVQRFDQEAKAVARLRHPNIVQVYDFDHDDGLYYMVLEYVPGDTLQARLKLLNQDGQVMSVDDAIRIMATTADAVGYAHEQNMIHRDLKPANVMLNLKDQPILMDFGVAKMLGAAQHTATGAIIGTAKYMSPEQARGDRPDARTDIYSLGVMLYEMVTGDPPFDAGSTVAILMKHVSEPLPDVHEIKPEIPVELVHVIEKALAKDRTERFQSATDMARDLRAIGQPQSQAAAQEATVLQVPEPSPVSAVPAAKQPARQEQKGGIPVWLIAVASVGLILVLGVGAFFIFSGSGDSATAEGGDVTPAGLDPDQGLPSSEAMTRVPSGTYTIGVDVTGETYAPTQQVDLSEFWIDQFEVTNADYAEFVGTTGQEPPDDWSNGNVPDAKENHPVDGVTWDDAVAYCQWAVKRLPTEAEWEVTARGAEGRLFPWGNNQSVVPLPQSGTYEVGSKPTNQSPFGVFDMAGNVWEWVGDAYAPVDQGDRVLRGGANGFLQNMAYRLQGDPAIPTMTATAGFRCAADNVDQPEVAVIGEDILFSDDFGDPGSGWPILTEGSFLYGYHPPAFYHVQVSTVDDHTVVSRDPDLTDFTVEANVQVFSSGTEAGDFRYGLAVRRSGDDQYYALVVSPRVGTWAVLKSSAAGIETLIDGTTESLRGLAPLGFTPDSDQLDKLRVDSQGERFIFFINEEAVAQVTDPDYESGEIGFFVENFDETLSHIHYDSLTIRESEFDEAVAVALAPVVDEPVPESTPTVVEASPTEADPTPTAGAATEPPSTSDTLATDTPEPTEEPTPTTEATEAPTDTPQPSPSASPTNTDTPEPSPSPTNTSTSTPEIPQFANMLTIEPDFFDMGSTTGASNEVPEHPVLLDGFLIDQFEVTNAEYRKCVADAGCTPAATTDSFTRSGYRDDPRFDDYPVVSVNWDQANAYCRWAGKRLPTEAEWEYAASGPQNFTWPWGNTFDPALSAANSADTEPVDSFAGGVSPLGLFNMAGNVNEWIADTFDESFYGNSPPSNPLNNSSGAGRIYRGGSFDNTDGDFYTTSRRYGNVRSFSEVDVGFRCAIDANLPASPGLVTEFCAVYADYDPNASCP